MVILALISEHLDIFCARNFTEFIEDKVMAFIWKKTNKQNISLLFMKLLETMAYEV